MSEVQCFHIQIIVERLMEQMRVFGTFLIVMYFVASSIPMLAVLQEKGYLNFMNFSRHYLALENSGCLIARK